EVDRPQAEDDLAHGHAAHVEQVVHDPGEMLHLPRHDLARADGGLLVVAHAIEDRHGAGDGAERVAQLVAQHGEELVLVAAELLGLRARRLGRLASWRSADRSRSAAAARTIASCTAATSGTDERGTAERGSSPASSAALRETAAMGRPMRRARSAAPANEASTMAPPPIHKSHHPALACTTGVATSTR